MTALKFGGVRIRILMWHLRIVSYVTGARQPAITFQRSTGLGRNEKGLLLEACARCMIS